MTTSISNCDRFADRLADFLEGDVDVATRASMDAHAMACANCGSLLADLRRLHEEAAHLPQLAPSVDLWTGIAERIQTPVAALEPTVFTRPGWSLDRSAKARRRRTSMWIGLAAAGLIAVTATVTATVTHEVTKRAVQTAALPRHSAAAPTRPAAGPPTVTASSNNSDSTISMVAAVGSSTTSANGRATSGSLTPAPARSTSRATFVTNRPSVQQTYASEIASLHTVLERRRPQLDSATVAVVEHNLHVIDDAIAQCKQALKKDPASQFLMESLNNAMDDKIQLLRTAATLPVKS